MAERLPDGSAPETYQMPEDGWVCFMCGFRFKKPGEAREHFGEKPAEQRLVKMVAVIKAARDDISDARHQCGGDGEGCEKMRDYYPESVQRRWRKCSQCPMDALFGTIEALAKLDDG